MSTYLQSLIAVRRAHASIVLCFFLGLFLSGGALSAQTTYTWNLAGDGSWATAANWTPTRTTPAADDIMVINNGGTKTINSVANQSIGRLLIQNNTQVTFSAGGGNQFLTIGNGAGDDLVIEAGSAITTTSNFERIVLAVNSTADISGTYNNGATFRLNNGGVVATVTNGGLFVNLTNGSVSGATAAKFAFQAGATYEHARNGSSIPLATWNATSNCNITGVANTTPTNNVQNFGNFTWNCPLQTGNRQFSNAFSIQGDFNIITTNTGQLRFSNDRANVVGGNFNQSGGILALRNNNTHSLTVNGNFTVSGGTFIKQGDNSPGGVLSVGGNFSLTGAGVLNGGNLLNVRFTGNMAQIFTSGGTVSGTTNFTVLTGAILQMAAASTAVTGNLFTLQTGATLGITSPEGITTDACGTGVSCGNIRTTTRTFNAAANYVYNDVAAQNTGDGLPSPLTGNLEIDNPAGVTLSAAQSINTPGALLLTDGNLLTNGMSLLVLGNGVTVIPDGGSAASFVSGPIRKVGMDAFTFPTGKGSTYAPISISAPSVVSDAFQAEYFNTAPPDMTLGTGVAEISNKEYWDLDRVAGTSAVSVTMGFTGNSMATMPDLSNLLVARFDGSLMTPAWVSEGNAGTTGTELTSGTVSSGAVLNFSFFTLGSTTAMNPLPVELAAFTATAKGQTVQLDWRTESELNNAFFDVERSANGRDFERIGKVEGAGTSLASRKYAFLDESPLNGWNYYRLRQEDFDGTFAYSPVQAVRMEKNSKEIKIQVFPNPTSSYLNLRTDDLFAPGDFLEIFDQTGRKVRRLNASAALNAPLDVSQLPAGVYFIRLQTASGKVQASFVKQ